MLDFNQGWRPSFLWGQEIAFDDHRAQFWGLVWGRF